MLFSCCTLSLSVSLFLSLSLSLSFSLSLPLSLTLSLSLSLSLTLTAGQNRQPLSSLGLISVTRSSQAALNIFLKNYRRSKTQLHDLSSKLINEIIFYPSSELFTGCPSKYISSKSCQHSVTPFSLMQPLFICLTFSVSTLHQDSSTPPLTQELYTFHT